MSDEAAMGGERVGIFGGSFNPPHVGHVLAAAYALLVCPIDRILIVPVYQHPFAKALTPFEHRLAMCERAFADLPRASVSVVERELGGESLTLRTLERLASDHPSWRMRLLVGSDVVGEVHKWHRFDRISEIAPPFIIARRGTTGGDRSILPEVSSTEVRALLAANDQAALEQLVPSSVIAYAREHRLFGLP
ncbi:MAG: nicotinate-nicotinamide nucleotide adenylyltransferase [Polyangiaceae bacterium]